MHGNKHFYCLYHFRWICFIHSFESYLFSAIKFRGNEKSNRRFYIFFCFSLEKSGFLSNLFFLHSSALVAVHQEKKNCLFVVLSFPRYLFKFPTNLFIYCGNTSNCTAFKCTLNAQWFCLQTQKNDTIFHNKNKNGNVCVLN